MKTRTVICAAAVPLLCGVGICQEPRTDVMYRTSGAFEAQVGPPERVNKTFEYVSAEAGIAGKVVKGAPYSATAATETVQVLADGTRITHQSSSSVARDSEGRTRRENSLPAIGPWTNDGSTPKLVSINDPVAGTTYMLDERTKTARKLLMHRPMPAPAGTGEPVMMERNVHIAGPGPGPGVSHAGGENVMIIHRVVEDGAANAAVPQPKDEQLGQETIEGVVADGTRTTVTLPAGSVGNDRPIEIVDERWYSPELQTTVLSKHNDPRMGETTFRLTKVSRAEPSASLFQVPPDYQIVEAGKDAFQIKIDKKP